MAPNQVMQFVRYADRTGIPPAADAGVRPQQKQWWFPGFGCRPKAAVELVR